jgi:uncharacterized surface protein with fasciclin (FAS1) repeats
MKKFLILLLLTLGIFLLAACQSEDNQIVAVDDLEDISVIIGSSKENINLPNSVRVELENGFFTEVSLDWEEALTSLDTQTIGEYTLTPDYTLPANVSLDNTSIFTITVTVIESDLLSFVASSENHTIFYEALTESGFDELLSLEGPFTLFAPTDEAFNALFGLLDITKEELLEREDLSNILNYHLLNTRYTRNNLVQIMPGTLTTLTGETLSFSLNGPRITINQVVSVLSSNEALSNGVIHVIDQVLFPPSSVDDTFTDLFDEELLNEILEILSASVSIPDLLAGNVSITVFIPSEAALTAFALTQGMDLETFIASSDFPALLTYHMVIGEYYASTLFESAPTTIESLNGESLDIEVTESILTINGASIISTEIFEGFGIIHEIDQVLVPPSLEDTYS